MVQFDNQFKQVKLKVVYYGPALGGKTTCLQVIHRVTDPQRRTKLYALNTASDRTLFFDLLSLDLGRVRGYRLMLQLYTVPGQVQYNATRRAVLAGADGIVFVADSQRSQAKANEESFANMVENLRANGLDPDLIPLVLQFNKRDLPDVLPRAELEALLKRRACPAFETVATTGHGVVEAFSAITEETVRAVGDKLGLAQHPEALGRLVANVRKSLTAYAPGAAAAEAPVITRPSSAATTLGPDELLGEAVRANMAMTDLNTQLDRLGQELARRVGHLRMVNEFGRVMSGARAPDDVGSAFMDRLFTELGVECGSLLLTEEGGTLVEAVRKGLTADPLHRPGPDGASPVAEVLRTRHPLVVHVDETNPVGQPWVEELLGLGLSSALAIPLVAQGRAIGVATLFGDLSRGPFEEDERELAEVLAANAAVALANARAWRALEDLNRTLEEQVRARTRELEEALGRTTALATQLRERGEALEQANRQLVDLEKLKGDLLRRIAHELNTPVTAIQTAARILTRGDELAPEKQTRFVAIIGQEATRLGELVASALQAAVLGVPEGRPKPAPVPLAELLKRVVAPLKGEVAAKGVQVHVKVSAGLEHVVGDGEQLEAALRALVKNAVEFSHGGGAVTVTVRPVRRSGGLCVEMQVLDAGVGIADEDLRHVGELFWQGGSVLTDKPRGLGLGVAVARRVAANHGGTLEVESTPGQGTTVSLIIPQGPPP
jgi:signal transduction histidine kinase/signal recognition particle receptor subunit beta